ncbi:hypothetical protein HX837_08435 [Marine Group I thaumarchaeote]|uniref:Uncharacterized protein n=1 Tax=Marine Group I thaumarchaeote TaxID=2511932 RepID=A0A7K4MSJ6_9ARCH|nr:hypothetical protein [Marine Group I thaumarchaeote]
MGIKFISGFRGLDHAKQHLRRSVHLGSSLTSGYTVLSPAEAFDQQACFVYLNGALLKEGTSGAGGDYVLSGTSTVTFNTAVATTDAIEVISYAFQNPTLPATMTEFDHTVTSANETYHSTAFASCTFTTATDLITTDSSAAHGLAIDDVISVTASSGTDTISTGRYRVLTVPSSSTASVTTVDGTAIAFGGNGTSVAFTRVFNKKVPLLTQTNHVMLFLNGMHLVKDTDYYVDQQSITVDSTVNLLENAIVAVRHWGSFATQIENEFHKNAITIADDTHNLLIQSSDLTGNTTAVFQLWVSVRHSTATNDAYRTSHLFVRAEKNDASDCYLHRAADAGNIETDLQVVDTGSYSTYANVTDGNIGVGITADANGWYVYLANRSSHSVVAGFKALAITN